MARCADIPEGHVEYVARGKLLVEQERFGLLSESAKAP
jgi:hypothetical protein